MHGYFEYTLVPCGATSSTYECHSWMPATHGCSEQPWVPLLGKHYFMLARRRENKGPWRVMVHPVFPAATAGPGMCLRSRGKSPHLRDKITVVQEFTQGAHVHVPALDAHQAWATTHKRHDVYTCICIAPMTYVNSLPHHGKACTRTEAPMQHPQIPTS